MSTSFAEPFQVEILYRSLSASETVQARTLLRMASNMLRQKVANIDARIAAFTGNGPGIANPLDPEIAGDIAATIVARAMRNPGGVKTQAVGPASVAYDDRVSAGFLYVTSDELAMLLPRPRPSIGTVHTRQGLAHGLERRAEPELRFGDFGQIDQLEGMSVGNTSDPNNPDSPDGYDDGAELEFFEPSADL